MLHKIQYSDSNTDLFLPNSTVRQAHVGWSNYPRSLFLISPSLFYSPLIQDIHLVELLSTLFVLDTVAKRAFVGVAVAAVVDAASDAAIDAASAAAAAAVVIAAAAAVVIAAAAAVADAGVESEELTHFE